MLSISKGLVDFCKFDNFRRFFRNNSAKNYRSDLPMSGKDASQWDLTLSAQKFSSKINSSAGMLEKPKKMAKIADFAHFGPLSQIYFVYVDWFNYVMQLGVFRLKCYLTYYCSKSYSYTFLLYPMFPLNLSHGQGFCLTSSQFILSIFMSQKSFHISW